MHAISLEDNRAQKELHGPVLSEEETATGNRRAASMKFSATERAWISETLHSAAAANRKHGKFEQRFGQEAKDGMNISCPDRRSH